MSIKRLKPITPGQRFRTKNTFSEISTKRNKPHKSLLQKLSKTGGRNNYGKMTIRHVGGRHKRKYRIIDYKRNKFGVTAIVKSIEYDPNRSSYIALLYYSDGDKRYIIAQNKIKIGQKIISNLKTPISIGNAMIIANIPLGTIISCIEMHPGSGAVLARSAGSYAQIIAKDNKYVTIKMPSGEIRMILINCMATIGSVSNPDHQLISLGKAGRKRWLGRRPRVRGVAMNPVDHPMGGGEGKSSGGHPRNRHGFPSKGYRTRKKKLSDKYILERRKK